MASGTQGQHVFVRCNMLQLGVAGNVFRNPGDLCGKSGTDYRCPEGTCDYDAGLRFVEISHMVLVCIWYVLVLLLHVSSHAHLMPFVTDTIELVDLATCRWVSFLPRDRR